MYIASIVTPGPGCANVSYLPTYQPTYQPTNQPASQPTYLVLAPRNLPTAASAPRALHPTDPPPLSLSFSLCETATATLGDDNFATSYLIRSVASSLILFTRLVFETILLLRENDGLMVVRCYLEHSRHLLYLGRWMSTLEAF